MFDFASVLTANPVGVFATQEGNKPRTRVFQFLFADGNKVYFCTNSEKPVYKQLQENPNVSFCSFTQDFSPVLSVNGKVFFVEDVSLKKRALDENPSIKGIYQTHENPIFKLFFVEVEEVETFSFTDGPRTYKM